MARSSPRPGWPSSTALSDAAGTISAELAPSSVEVRMSGEDPDFVVSVPTVESEPTLLFPEPTRNHLGDDDRPR